MELYSPCLQGRTIKWLGLSAKGVINNFGTKYAIHVDHAYINLGMIKTRSICVIIKPAHLPEPANTTIS